MKKLVLLFILVLIILSQGVLASNFTLEIIKSDQYLAGRAGLVEAVIVNSGPADIFSISILGIPSGWLTPEASAMKLKAGETQKMKIYVNPTKDASPKIYEYTISATSTETGDSQAEQLLLYIEQVTSVIINDFSLSCISCQDLVDITGTLENVGTVDLSDVTLKLILEDQEVVIETGKLNVYDKSEFSHTFSLEDYRPKNYDIKAEILSGDKRVYNDIKQLSIPRIINIKYSEKISDTPFGKFVTLSAENLGNDIDTAEFTSEIIENWYSIYSGPEPYEIDNNYNKWRTELNPEAKSELKYSQIYWPTYVIIAIVIIIGLITYLQFTALKLKKAIVGKNIVKKGKQMSVTLVIKNRVREMTNVVVKDTIPKQFKVTGSFETIKPTLRKVSGGTELVWKIGRLKANEQRVLHYKIKPVSPVSRMNLPRAGITAKYFDNLIAKRSNYVLVYSKDREPAIIPVEIK